MNKELIETIDGIDFLKFTPTVMRHYDKCYKEGEEPDYWRTKTHWFRMLLLLLRKKYEVIYLKRGEQILGHFVITKGGNFADSKSDDIIIGPIWINPVLRKQGIGTKGLNVILHRLDINYRSAYGNISPANLASIRIFEKNGFKYIGKAVRTGL
jgi:RimJ/RimL family protein N-acetyltransferase